MPFRRIVLLCLLVLCVSSLCACDAKAPRVVWFADKETHGLSLDKSGRICLGSQQLALDKEPGQLFGAVYYPGDAVLMTVDKDTTVRMYQGPADRLILKKSERLREEWRMDGVTFTRVPGLMYVAFECIPPPQPLPVPQPKPGYFESLWGKVTGRKPAQVTRCINNLKGMATWGFRRVVLLNRALDWHVLAPIGSTDNAMKLSLAPDCYRVSKDKRRISLSLEEGKWIVARLREPLCTLPVPVDQLCALASVQVLPGHGMICRTKQGLSLHKPNGAFVKWFYVGDERSFSDATYRDGQLYVRELPAVLHSTRLGHLYRLDVKRGKLVPEK